MSFDFVGVLLSFGSFIILMHSRGNYIVIFGDFNSQKGMSPIFAFQVFHHKGITGPKSILRCLCLFELKPEYFDELLNYILWNYEFVQKNKNCFLFLLCFLILKAIFNETWKKECFFFWRFNFYDQVQNLLKPLSIHDFQHTLKPVLDKNNVTSVLCQSGSMFSHFKNCHKLLQAYTLISLKFATIKTGFLKTTHTLPCIYRF